jgi:hypothetical protein
MHIPEWSYAHHHGKTMIMEMGEWTHIPEWSYARQYFG